MCIVSQLHLWQHNRVQGTALHYRYVQYTSTSHRVRCWHHLQSNGRKKKREGTALSTKRHYWRFKEMFGARQTTWTLPSDTFKSQCVYSYSLQIRSLQVKCIRRQNLGGLSCTEPFKNSSVMAFFLEFWFFFCFYCHLTESCLMCQYFRLNAKCRHVPEGGVWVEHNHI